MQSDELMKRPLEILEEIRTFEAKDAEDLERFRVRFLGAKGLVKELSAAFRELPAELKKEYGQRVNAVKKAAEEKVANGRLKFGEKKNKKRTEADLSRPVQTGQPGSRHPISLITDEIIDLFRNIGFNVAEGPEIEDDWHNFTALNLPPEHPARDMQDTFFIQRDPDLVLRTHTSPVQIRYMEKHQPPIRIIAPGRVYRVDNDSTHSPVFHQVEGLYVAENVSFAELKKTLYYFVQRIFGEDVEVRFRPSFFPFTEPSAEMDIAWNKGGEKKWMEIMGCGMVDPNVLKNCNIDPDRYTGYAFGMGVERIAMLKYKIRDIRTFYENDIRFISQFKSAH